MNRTAVVILNWNGLELLKRFLPKVIGNTPDADIVIADNASTDGSESWVANNYPDVTLITFDKNYGYAQGYNKAIKLLESYTNIILLNSDAYPAPHWIKPLEETLKQENVVAVQPKILQVNDHKKFEYAGAAGGFLDKNGYPYCRGRIFDTIETDDGQYDEISEIFWASGAALAIKRDKFIDVGGLDHLFFAHMEEIDLCWRLKLNGGTIMFQPHSVVFHLGGGSLQMQSPQKSYLNFRNNLLMLYKNTPEGWAKRWLLARRRLLDAVAFIRFLCTAKWRHAKAILKAHNDFRRMKNNYNLFPRVDLLKEERCRNILTQYYLKRRRHFSELS